MKKRHPPHEDTDGNVLFTQFPLRWTKFFGVKQYLKTTLKMKKERSKKVKSTPLFPYEVSKENIFKAQNTTYQQKEKNDHYRFW